MATSLALKKLLSSALLPNPLRRLAAPASHPTASRLFSTYTNAAPDVWTRGLGRVGRLADLGPGILPMSRAMETKDELCVWMDMPGLGEENVKITMDQKHNALLIKGERSSEKWDSHVRSFSSSIDLPVKLRNTHQIKAEMKNGVLKVVMPKVKEEERSHVFHVLVESAAEPGFGLVMVVVGVLGVGVGLGLGLGLVEAGTVE